MYLCNAIFRSCATLVRQIHLLFWSVNKNAVRDNQTGNDLYISLKKKTEKNPKKQANHKMGSL